MVDHTDFEPDVVCANCKVVWGEHNLYKCPNGETTFVPEPDRIAALEGLLREAFLELRHAKIFTTSREKMHPTGQELYDRLVERIEAALGGSK